MDPLFIWQLQDNVNVHLMHLCYYNGERIKFQIFHELPKEIETDKIFRIQELRKSKPSKLRNVK